MDIKTRPMQANGSCDGDAREARDPNYRTIYSHEECHIPHVIDLATCFRKLSADECIDTVRCMLLALPSPPGKQEQINGTSEYQKIENVKRGAIREKSTTVFYSMYYSLPGCIFGNDWVRN